MAEDPPASNLLLRAIPQAEYESFAADLEFIQLPRGRILVEAGEEPAFVYFPDGAVVSSLTLLESGATVEAATIGKEGMCSLSAVLGGPDPTQLIIQIGNGAARMSVAVFRRHLAGMPGFRSLLGLYANAYIGQLAQSSACNAMHDTAERCARWLLATDDRTGHGGSFLLTQEFLAAMLGVQRPTVTIAAGTLQRAGFITSRRGRVDIIDRPGLEASARRFNAIFDGFPMQRL
jgi:CRP-like cAMP-binding protein